MRPGFTRTGLHAWMERVPLPLAVPPGPPSTWTCLLELLGTRLALATDGYGTPRLTDEILRHLLDRLGQGTPGQLPRALLLVLPVPPLRGPLIDLLRPALSGSLSHEGPRALAAFGDRAAVPWLEELLAASEMPGSSVIDALGHLHGGREGLARWDGSCDAERLRALVRQGVFPATLPSGSLDPLAPVFPSLDPDALRDALESLDSLEGAAVDAVGLLLARQPALAASLADVLPAEVHRAVEHPSWGAALTAAAGHPDGEEALDGLIEQLAADDWRHRMGAVIALGGLPTAEVRVLDALRARLGDDDPDVRREVGVALNRLGQSAPIESWTERYGFLERAEVHPWGAALCGGPVPLSLFAMLSRRDGADVLARAVLVLASAHPELAVPSLEAFATDGSFEIPLVARQAAAAGLLLAGVAPSDRPDVHRVLLRDVADGGVSGPIAGLSESGLVALVARDGDWQVRHAALGLLGRSGAAAKHDPLLAMLADWESDDDVRRRANELRGPRWRATGVGPGLAAIVVGSRVDSQARARGLQEIERDAPELVGALAVALLDHPDREMAVLAARIAGRTAGEAIGERVAWALQHLRAHDWIRREAAAALLGSLEPSVLEAALREELIEVLEAASTDDDDRDVQRMAGWAAGRLGAA
jgi:HEAT repeat protein